MYWCLEECCFTLYPPWLFSAGVFFGCQAFDLVNHGVGHDHVCAIFADSAPSNVCEFPIMRHMLNICDSFATSHGFYQC